MSDTKWARGPWSAAEVRAYGNVRWDCLIRDPNQGPVASVGFAGWGKETASANASLIAAAPELYSESEQSCDEMCRVADQISSHGLIDLADDLSLRAASHRKAMAKARGEQS